jgi:3-phosphoshikimate 1-carboxyvinyltransferase
MPRPWPDDVVLMVSALTALGVRFEERNDTLHVLDGLDRSATSPISLDAGEGAAPARFLLALAAGLSRPVTVSGHGRLPQRPFAALSKALADLGVQVRGGPGLPLTVTGPTSSGRVAISTDESTQFLSGLMLAGPLLGGLEVLLPSGWTWRGYAALTRQVMAAFGVDVEDPCRMGRGAAYAPTHYAVESDWSGGAVLLAAGAILGRDVVVPALNLGSAQPDAAVADLLTSMGYSVTPWDGGVRLEGKAMQGIHADLTDTPDLAAVLIPLAAMLPFESRLAGLGKLRLKESDRLDALTQMIAEYGAYASLEDEALTVRGIEEPASGLLKIRTHGDHRMAMAGALLGLRRPVEIDDATCVTKSFPKFFHQWPGATGLGQDS